MRSRFFMEENNKKKMKLSQVEENRKENQCDCNMGKECVCYVLGWNAKCISH